MLTRYEAVLAALNAGVVVHAADTQILEANDRARELLGLQDLEGRLATDPQWVFLEADYSPMPLERFPVMQVIASGAPVRGLPMVIRPPGGPDVWFEVNALPIVGEDGQLDQVVVTFIDVSASHLTAGVLAAAEEESRLAFDSSSVATCLVANDGRLIRVNRALCDFFERSEAELLTMTFLDVTHPDDVDVGMEMVRELLDGTRTSLRLTKRYVTGTGRVIWGDITVSAIRDPDGSVRHRVAQILDVTAEHDLRVSLMEAEMIAHVGGWQLHVATGRVTWSQELYRMFGLDPTGPVPDYTQQARLFTPESWTRLSAAVAHTQETGEPYRLEVEIVRPDGSRAWIEARGVAIRNANGDISALHGVSLDITDRKAARDQLQSLATHDPLTGLVNRAELLDEITRAVNAARRSGRSVAVLMMDLDRFKDVNDTLGHAIGDGLLVAAANRLVEVVRGGDLVARLGGDEFVVVMRDLEDPNEAMLAAERLVQRFRTPFTIGDRELFATASVGVALADGTAKGTDLLREADTAMYAAKAAGRDRVSSFNEDLRKVVSARLSVESDLRFALQRDQLAVWYQPEVDLSSGSVVALEALLRWHHPDGQVWSADRFVTVAEDTGLILEMGEWVLREACFRAANWTSARPDRPITVRVNVSALQLVEAGMLCALDEALAASGLDPAQLCIELTETTLLHGSATVSANLAGIHDRGITLAIDDFGIGYASLSYLDQYPIDVIKIDRSFIADSGGANHQLVAGIVALAAVLGIVVTAEGVEHAAQAAHLRQMGCPSAQGWLYSPAVPPEDVDALLDCVYPHP